ncbi:HAUS augmin-like complex subunit 4 [Syngnathoides biaculeatus]|uniref:HAUS augmin-like complex subunit 4 n=1 Tax=Syngnathoides biaculeatus TaxID=300417 RepID=UPI002ADE8D80|nr:HAUS augmin-like complex subunit 4 [Syngnathoides biaculeatus]
MSAELGLPANENGVDQKVLAAFPLCDVTEEDLRQNPQFCQLLTALAHHVDKMGLTGPLKTELEKAEQKLMSQRRVWLQSESLTGALQEMIQDHKVRKRHAAVPPDQSTFYETVEKCLLVARCARLLDPSDTTEKDRPSVLALTPQRVTEFMPSANSVERMKQILPAALEEHLSKKCFTFLCYYQPECENRNQSPERKTLSHLTAQLKQSKKKAEDLKERSREKRALLQRQTRLGLSEMIQCVRLMQSFILENRLKFQVDLDRDKLDYFEGKCELISQKIKAEMVAVRLETYTVDSISAHKEIRKSLQSELRSCQAEKNSVESKLFSFEILGKEFEALAEEYGKLRQEIDVKNWALKEFATYDDQ